MENCPFYNRIGACRHGDTCTRIHNRPDQSPTILLTNFYHNPKHKTIISKGAVIEDAPKITDEEEQKNFDEFFEEVYMEVEEEYGEIDEMNVCTNLGRHLYGNVYIKFHKNRDARRALLSLNNRWFDGRPINVELSPVLDFYVACCPQFDRGECERKHFCNFMHLKPISRELRKKIERYVDDKEDKKRKERKKKRESKRLKKVKRERDRRSVSSRSQSTHSTDSSTASSNDKSLNSQKSGRSLRASPNYGTSPRSPPLIHSSEKKRSRSLEKYAITGLSANKKHPINISPSDDNTNNHNDDSPTLRKTAKDHSNLVEAYFEKHTDFD